MGDWVLLKRPRGSIIPHPVSGAAASPQPAGAAAGAAKSPPQQRGAGAVGAPAAGPTAGAAAAAAAAPWARAGSNPTSLPQRPSGSSSSSSTEGPGLRSGVSTAGGLKCSPYAKFTTVGDPTPLWLAAAEELAQYAVQVRGWPSSRQFVFSKCRGSGSLCSKQCCRPLFKAVQRFSVGMVR